MAAEKRYIPEADFDATEDTALNFAARAGKNLRMEQDISVYGDKRGGTGLMDTSYPTSWLYMSRDPQRACSFYQGVEFARQIVVKEGALQQKGSASLQTVNAGELLQLIPGSKATTFSYRLEHEKSKTCVPNVNSVSVMCNSILLPENAGVADKLSISYYPRQGCATQEEADALIAQGVDAFVTDNSLVNTTDQHREKLAAYYVLRCREMQAGGPMHPAPEINRKLKALVLRNCVSRTKVAHNGGEDELWDLVCDLVTVCDGHSPTSKGPTLAYTEGEEAEAANLARLRLFQPTKEPSKPGVKKARCFCTLPPTALGCHVTAIELKSKVKNLNPELYDAVCSKDKSLDSFILFFQKKAGLKEEMAEAKGYPKRSFFGFKKSCHPAWTGI